MSPVPTTPTPDADEPPTFVDQAFKGIEDFAFESLKMCPEIRSLVVVVDWATGPLADVPFGAMIGRNGRVQSPVSLFGCMTQTVKMLAHQASAFQELLQSANTAAEEIANAIRSKRAEYAELESAVAKKKAEIAEMGA